MTQVCPAPRRPQAPQASADRKAAERLLRDAAVVLHLTQRVRADILKGPVTRALLAAAA
ncbi:MAG TPA: hypothetical protein VFG68_00295 [Fimbriiglobus sp.]|nr:hypothetical protein [Fimbriiglobus sp.]